MNRLARMFAFATLLGVAIAGCKVNPYNLAGDGDGGVVDGDGGVVDGDGGGPGIDAGDGGGPDIDAGDVCIPTQEVCDEADNDCDGEIDEGFDTSSDPDNCGACGTECFRFGTNGTCDTGACQYSCLSGFVDLDMDILDNGCEYVCTPTLANEVGNCDLTDNDCDGSIDEDVDITEDIDNCGGCGNLCRVLNASPDCVPVESDPTGNPGVFDDGTCSQGPCDCTLTECFEDVLSGVPGCEYLCPFDPISIDGGGVPTFPAEVCDGLDQDCTGVADDNLSNFDRDGNPNAGADNSCHPFLGALGDGDAGTDVLAGVGACNFGTWSCSGDLNCVGAGLPAAQDLCGNGDEDCDGNIDEDADLQNDVNNCGACGTDCNVVLANTATAQCNAAVCESIFCDQGFTLGGDADPTQGCDYACTVTGPEVCDGADNDCDELTDVEDADLAATFPGNGSCRQLGGCGLSGTVVPQCGVPGQGATTERGDLSMLPATCAGASADWFCPYDTTVVQVNATTCEVVTQESACDDADNDCDTAVDEVFTDKGDDCFDTALGVCQSSGKVDCTLDTTGTVCDFAQGTPGGTSLGFEACNGIDDDCDGLVDSDDPDGVVDEMVEVTFASSTSCVVGTACSDTSGNLSGTCDADTTTCRLWVDAHEASRPDATDTAAGTDERLSCSLSGKLPWSLVTQPEAEAACSANGKRLCTQEEWQLSCGGDSGLAGTTCTSNGDCVADVEFCNLDQGSPGFCAFLYPYGTAYEAFTCNGGDWNDACLPPEADTMEQVFETGYGYSPGGSPASCPIAPVASCESDFNAFDMSGNLREWTGTPSGASFEVRGGSFTDIAEGITCDNDFIALAPASTFDNLGFRCCRDTAPPVAP